MDAWQAHAAPAWQHQCPRRNDAGVRPTSQRRSQPATGVEPELTNPNPTQTQPKSNYRINDLTVACRMYRWSTPAAAAVLDGPDSAKRPAALYGTYAMPQPTGRPKHIAPTRGQAGMPAAPFDCPSTNQTHPLAHRLQTTTTTTNNNQSIKGRAVPAVRALGLPQLLGNNRYVCMKRQTPQSLAAPTATAAAGRWPTRARPCSTPTQTRNTPVHQF